jgi:hypothetical protein
VRRNDVIYAQRQGRGDPRSGVTSTDCEKESQTPTLSDELALGPVVRSPHLQNALAERMWNARASAGSEVEAYFLRSPSHAGLIL